MSHPRAERREGIYKSTVLTFTKIKTHNNITYLRVGGFVNYYARKSQIIITFRIVYKEKA